MSSRPPTTTQENEANIFYPTRLGPRYGMMTEGPIAPAPPHPYTPPATSRPQLPPPSHLEPSFVPQSPQVRPQYSDLPTRAVYPAYPRQVGYENAPPQDYRPITQPTAPLERSNYGSSSHPPLYPQRVSYQSTNPGTLYEALSPVDYATHGPPPEPSMFNEGGYTTTTPYPMAALQQLHQSPTSSYQSSATSSSGLTSAQIPFNKPEAGLEPPSQTSSV